MVATSRSLSVQSATGSTSGFTVHDPSFTAVLGASPQLRRVVHLDAHEGPVYAADEDALYVTSLPTAGNVPLPGTPTARVRRIQLDGLRFPLDRDHVRTVDAAVTMPNGMTMAPDGGLLVCEQGDRAEHARVSRLDRVTGGVTTLVDGWSGRRLNSPNDVVVHPRDGSVWFTDPSYGFLQGFRPQPQVGDFVYRLDPETGSLTVVADSFEKPNGIAFSPDGSTLYVTDSGANQEPGSFHVHLPHRVVAYDVTATGQLVAQRLLAVTAPGTPDGITTDEAGRVYVSSERGVLVLTDEGDLLGSVDVPGAVNFTFGGPDRNVLFITADTAVWAAVLDTRGA